ncbi:MAG TPA: zinc ABC transporter substrate-binding protein [Sandaracinaceae bacterium LLY-WYZ-13_1]|nr:zinc ABC transporter substrate-binding protein [Sandaracinaceae bacterium LLY-WYZ-13_1]
MAPLVLRGCLRPEHDPRPVIVVSVLPQAWFVERLAGDAGRIVVMVPPGASPATHEPTINQVRAVARAALYVKVGHPAFPFERAWLDRLMAETEGIRRVSCLGDTSVHPGDPHLWTSPRHMRRVVPDLAAALAEVLPEHDAAIERSARRLEDALVALDRDLARTLSDLPRRRFYVFHPSWGYLARDYGLEQVPIELGAKEPDAYSLRGVLERARRDGARTVFAQPQFSRRAADLVADAIDGRVVALDPLARDWDDNLRRVARALRAELAR